MSAASPDDPLIGRVLAGSYRLEALLGEGAMGRVYRAQHTLIPQAFAVKVLRPELAQDEELRKRFLQEARALLRFVHRNVVPVRHCGEEGGLVFLAMDLCRGETLEALLAREPALDERRAVGLAQQILAALEEAHASGIVHRDLKPANVMLEPPEEGAPGGSGEHVRVLDFGLSRILGAGRDGAVASRVSQVGEVVGTVAYMSPEQALGHDLDGRSDLFSLGVMLFEMVEGRHPFLGGTLASVVTRLIEVAPLPAAPGAARRASAGLQRVLGHAMQRDPVHRYADAAAFAADLKALGSGASIAAPFDARVEARRRGRRRAAWRAAVAVLLLGLGAWGLSTVLGGGATPVREDSRNAGHAAAAEGALARGDWRAAVSALEPLVTTGSASAEQRLALAAARVELGDPEVDRDFHALARLLPDDARVAVLRGRWQHRVRGDPEKAMAEFAAALVKDRRSLDAREARLDLLLDRGQAAWFAGRRANRFAQALDDVAAMVSGGAERARVALARSRIELASAEASGSAGDGGVARTLRDAAASAAEAAHEDPRSAEAAAQQVRVALRQAHDARITRRPLDAAEHARLALEAADVAVRRAVEHPTHRAQGGRLVELRRLKLSAAIHAADGDAIAAEVRALMALEPPDAQRLTEQAFGLRTAGRFEDAVSLYETLREIAPDASVLGDLAFCHQRIGLTRLLGGERETGIAALERAIRIYGEALQFSDNPVVRAYRGETHGLLARWKPTAREEHLAAAQRDLDDAMRAPLPQERQEILFRRSAVRFMAADLEGAHADIASAVEGQPALNPAFHGRMARTALALLLLRRSTGAAEAGLYELALAQARESEARSGAQTGSSRLIQAQIRLLAGPESDHGAARADIESALAPGALPDPDATTEAQGWLVLAEALPAADAVALLDMRRRDLLAGRDMATAAFDQGVARLADAAGDAGLAARLRDLSTRRP
jgi:serine/threonine-protein kinase